MRLDSQTARACANHHSDSPSRERYANAWATEHEHWREWDESEHPRDEDGKFTFSGGGAEFVSPNVESDLGLDQAVEALSGRQQATLKEAGDFIDRELRLKGDQLDAVGAWQDGAENTVVDVHPSSKWTDWERLKLAASMKGHIADQKSVLVFQGEQNRKPRESVAAKLTPEKTITVEVNPTGNELRALAKEHASIRIIIDADGNLYAWDAGRAIHAWVANALDIDERHEDQWFLYNGKLVSERYLDETVTQAGQHRDMEREAAQEVRDKLASLEGNAVLLSFDAKGSLAKINSDLLKDGLAFHTLVPYSGGATVYVAEVDPNKIDATVDAVEKAAKRYDSEITYRHGRGEFIGDTEGSGSDREQRDRARKIYEANIEQSPVPGSAQIWAGVHDRWRTTADEEIGLAEASPRSFSSALSISTANHNLAHRYSPDQPRDEDGKWTDGGGGSDSDGGAGEAVADKWSFAGGPHGEKWQAMIQPVIDNWHADHARVQDKTTELTHDINTAMLTASNYTDWKDWYAESKQAAENLFGKEYAPVFEQFIAATSINTPVKQNVRLALQAMAHWLGGGKFDQSFKGTTNLARNQLQSVVDGLGVHGPKVEAFSANLQGDLSQATIDRWMKVLLFAHPTVSGGKSGLPQSLAGQAVVKAMADKMGWKPAQLQACLWASTMIMHGEYPSKLTEHLASQESMAMVAKIRAIIAAQKGAITRTRAATDDPLDVLEQAGEAYWDAALLFEYIAALKEEFPEITEVE